MSAMDRHHTGTQLDTSIFFHMQCSSITGVCFTDLWTSEVSLSVSQPVAVSTVCELLWVKFICNRWPLRPVSSIYDLQSRSIYTASTVVLLLWGILSACWSDAASTNLLLDLVYNVMYYSYYTVLILFLYGIVHGIQTEVPFLLQCQYWP